MIIVPFLLFMLLYYPDVNARPATYTLPNSTLLFKTYLLKEQIGIAHNNPRIFLIDHKYNSNKAQHIIIGKLKTWIKVSDLVMAYHPSRVNYDRRKVIINYINQLFAPF